LANEPAEHPKHLLRLLDDRTLLETTVCRLEGLFPLRTPSF
jgi:mannose-1-phosphate guanylyltransferase